MSEVGWLIELSGPTWWDESDRGPSWCVDSNKAVRFARKEDAERAIRLPGLIGVKVRSTEHIWISAADVAMCEY